ncbi:hypothetical protein PFICI_00406 [Pestalotiopsis fici W106-1]|uniref:Nephrocystin 3-like N-terminal domain-containing protein n=1 Tax=Pestalotiopsis fici (strain W106-1 / CGMCC3.15140) TaxID=1229662 RepID=W3XKJ2_PESFW|nr:uncharacterized protein PFICI_00406 [Pestalotiopsis fici W106-1]ETS86578.1 hypothetical protein PFICI_00406 [Pestalotiopsis fici W106-1]
MPSNTIGHRGPGPQIIAAGSGDQFTQSGSGSKQFNNSTFYGYPQIEAANELHEEKEACLSSLAFPAIDARRHDIAPAYDGTCDWFFATPEFHEWQHPTRLADHNEVLWLKGKPGAGKSTLMKHIWIQCKEKFFRDHIIAAYFFHARGEELERTPLGMLRSILYQLLKNNESLYQDFVPRFREKERTSRGRDLQWREAELKEFLRSVLNEFRSPPLLLLIDALDECNGSDVHAVIEFVESLSISASQSKVPFKICLSSRHFPNINMGKMLKFTVEGSEDHLKDISKYLAGRLRIHEADLEEEIIMKADGIFLWVVIVVSLLNKAYDEGRVEAMRRILNEIPDDLEKIFSTILAQDPSTAAETVVMLQLVLLSVRPLEPRELFAAVVKTALPSNDIIERRIITTSRGLLEVRKGGSGSVQFIHLSVSDFLFQQSRLEKLDPTLGSESIIACHSRIWARCRSCMEQIGAAIAKPGQIAILRAKDPFLVYVAGHILDHAERALANGTSIQNMNHLDIRCNQAHSSSELPIREWLRDSDSWLGWWKLLIAAAGSDEERLGLESEKEVGLAYVLALRGLPNLSRAALPDVDVNLEGGWYGNALQAASYGGHKETVDILLQRGADISAPGGYYGHALQAAAHGGHREIIDVLLKQGADVNAQGGHYGNALQAASWGGHKETIDLLLERGADINGQCGYYGHALQAASFEGHQDVVELLLQRGADVNAQGGYYGYALQAASHEGHQDIIELLLRRGADISAQGGHYGHALQAASYEGHQDIVELLLRRGAVISAQGGHYGDALQAASYGRCQDIVELLLRQGADVNARGGYFGTALQAASNRGHREIVKLLLENDADVNIQGGRFGNALQAAAAKGYRVILEMLLQKGANILARGGHFGNALQAASYGGSPKTVVFLLDNGANIATAGGHFGNPLQAACRGGHYEIVQLLVEKGADVNAQGGKYGNALQAASSRGHDDIVKFLLDHGAHVNAPGGKYENSLQAATSAGHEDTLKLLLGRGAIASLQSEEKFATMFSEREATSHSQSSCTNPHYVVACAIITSLLAVIFAFVYPSLFV